MLRKLTEAGMNNTMTNLWGSEYGLELAGRLCNQFIALTKCTQLLRETISRHGGRTGFGLGSHLLCDHCSISLFNAPTSTLSNDISTQQSQTQTH